MKLPGPPWPTHRAPPDLLDRALARAAAEPRPSVAMAIAWRALPIAAALVLGVGLGFRWGGAPEPVPAPAAEPSERSADQRLVSLVFRAEPGRRVAVAASWNAWAAEATPMQEIEAGVYRVVIPLEPGEHEYMFVVDGAQWVTDPTAARHRDDGFGHQNAVLAL